MTKKQYNSGRVERTPQLGITSDRYQFLGLDQAEPNLGDPKVGPSSTGANPIPIGQVYQVVSVDTTEGGRFWTPLVGFGTTVGVISVYENGVLPGGDNRFQRIQGLNFVGNGVTISTPPIDGPFEGVGIATIQFALNELVNQGKVGQVIYNSQSGNVDGASDFYYNPSTLFVGIGSTQPSVKLDVDGDGFVSGVLTSHFFQTGTGAVKRTVESKLKEPYISIADFGAVKGNFSVGVSSANGDAIQAAINAAITSGVRAVFVPAGVWYCSKPLTINSDISLFGFGANTINSGNKSEIRFIANTTASDGLNGTTGIKTAITVATGISTDTKIFNLVIKDIGFSAVISSLQGQDITAMRVVEASDSRIQNCAFTSFDKALTLEGVARMMITNNHFSALSRTIKPTHAISFRQSEYGNDCTGNHVTDNEIRGRDKPLPSVPFERVFEVLNSDALYLNHNHLVEYDVGLYIRATVGNLGDIHSGNQYYDQYRKHCVLVESAPGDITIRDLVFNSDYFRGGQLSSTGPAIKIDNNPNDNVVQSLSLIGCRISQSIGGPGIAITNPIPQVRNLNIKDCEFAELNRSTLSTEYNHLNINAVNASITGNIFDSQDTVYLSGTTGAANGKCVVVSAGTSQYIFSDNIFYTTSNSHNVVTLPELNSRQVFGNIHNNQYLENFTGSVKNLKGGSAGSVVYQSDVGITSFVSVVGANEKFLKFDGTKPVWSDVAGVSVSNFSITEDNSNFTRYLPLVDVSSGVSTIRANNSLTFNPSTGNLGIGTTSATRNLDVNGTVRIRGGLYDGNNNVGSGNSVLLSTGSGIRWTNNLNLSVGYASTSGFSTTSAYANNAGVSTNLASGTTGSIPYQSNTGVTTFLAGSGTDGFILDYNNNAPRWRTPSTLSVGYASTSGFSTTSGYAAIAGVATNLGSGAAGSIPYQTSSGITTFLAASPVDGYILEYDTATNKPQWVSPSNLTISFASISGYSTISGFSTISGYASTSGFSTTSGYAAIAGVATNLGSGAAGSIPYQSNTGVTTFLAASAIDGYILEYDTTTNKPQWVSPNSLTITNVSYASSSGIATNIRGGNSGELIYQSSSNNTAFISTTSASDKFLQFKNGVPTWSDIPGVSTITVNSDNTNNTRFIPFVDNVGGETTLRGNSLLAFNPSNSRIGIGTSTLNATLNVVPVSNSVAGLFSGSSTNNIVTINQTGSGNALLVDEAQPFVISGIGSVGIGIATPSHLLDVNGVARLRGALRDSNNQPGTSGQILQSTGTGVSWTAATTTSGVGTGGSLDLYEENTKVGAATSLRFVSANLTVSVASSVGVVTLTSTPTFTTVTSGRFLSTTTSILVGSNSGLNLNSSSLNNVLIGNDAGRSLTDGLNNIMLGYGAGQCLTGCSNVVIGSNVSGSISRTASNSIFIGNYNGTVSQYNTSIIMGTISGNYGEGSSNIFLGNYAGNGVDVSSFPGQINHNVFIGDCSGGLVDGSIDNVAIGRYSGYKVKGAINNVYLGPLAGYGNVIGQCNIFAGFCAGYGSTTFNPSGCTADTRACNVFIGPRSGLCLNAGNNNVFLGANSGTFIGDGCRNIFIGREAGQGLNANNPIQGCNNIAIGVCALTNITSGLGNIALAQCSHFTLTTGSDNITMGRDSGFSVTSGSGNITIGKDSGSRVTTGCFNVILGHQVGLSTIRNITGSQNIILSSRSVNFLTSGSSNIIIGAGHSINTGVNNITISPPNGNTGLESLLGGETLASTYVGSALTTLSGISSTIVIGNTGITNFYTKMAQKSGGSAVSWNSTTNELTAATSSLKFKTDIRPYSKGIEDLIKLESVRYKPIENPNGVDQVGLIAEQVDEAGLTEFVVYDIDDAPLSLSYDRMIALAINAIKELKAEIDTLKERIDILESQ